MKKIIAIITTVLLISCNLQQHKKPAPFYEINGVLKKYTGKVYLTYGNSIDSAAVINGKFKFTGSVTDTIEAHISLTKDRGDEAVYLENSTMKFYTRVDTIISTVFRLATDSIVGSYSANLIKNYQTFYVNNSSKTNFPDLLYAKLDTLIKANKRHPFSGGILAGNAILSPILTKEQFLKLYSELDTLHQTKTDLKLFKRAMVNLSKYTVGSKFLDFKLPNQHNDSIPIASLYAQYTLVDFWASWCGSCRVTNPRIVALKNEFKEDYFNVVSISIDENTNDWIKAIEKDKLNWPQLLDKDKTIHKELGKKAIPYSYLVDKEGGIIKISPSVDDVRLFLNSKLNEGK